MHQSLDVDDDEDAEAVENSPNTKSVSHGVS